MHFVLLATHEPDLCPTASSTVRKLLAEVAPQIPAIADKTGVKIVAGPFVNREHLTVAVVETDRPEDLDRFLIETRLPQWNSVRIIPSVPMAEGVSELEDLPALF